jgi:hypothetical protein
MHKIFTFLFFLVTVTHAGAQQKNVLGEWNPGYYYDLQNNKIIGEIKWSAPNRSPFKGAGDNIAFRINMDEKKQKISTTQLKSFVIGIDSFVVSHNKDLELYPVLFVLIDRPTKLYVRLRTNNTYMGGFNGGAGSFYTGLDQTYYYGADPNNIIELDSDNFIKVMSDIMSDRPDLVTQIQNKKFKKGSLQKLLDQYYFERNARIAKEAADKKE